MAMKERIVALVPHARKTHIDVDTFWKGRCFIKNKNKTCIDNLSVRNFNINSFRRLLNFRPRTPFSKFFGTFFWIAHGIWFATLLARISVASLILQVGPRRVGAFCESGPRAHLDPTVLSVWCTLFVTGAPGTAFSSLDFISTNIYSKPLINGLLTLHKTRNSDTRS